MALEINTYFGRCRCCLSYGYLNNMWEAYYNDDGKKEIYIVMLDEVFALNWQQMKQTEEQSKFDHICDICVTKLRDAYNFKNTILEAQLHILDNAVEEEPENEVKLEDVKEEDKVKVTEDSNLYVEECQHFEITEIDFEHVFEETEVKENDPLLELREEIKEIDYREECKVAEEIEMDYEEIEYLEEVEYLEEEFLKETVPTTQSPRISRRSNKIDTNSNIKLDKRSPKCEERRVYRQYSNDDLRACLKAVWNEKLTPREASKIFNIPRRTIAAKIKMGPSEIESQLGEDKYVREEKRFKLIGELKSILTYTNAMLFKTHSNRYLCAYCSGEYYDNPDELRAHTKTKHKKEKIKEIDFTMKPYWLHEIVKLDIHRLECMECSIPIPDWNEMLKHVKDKHNVVLDQAYTKAIPYDLNEQLKCVLCEKEFMFFNFLETHMNSHYRNYVCFDCGDVFATEIRLKKHVKTHDAGKHACVVCRKTFPTLKKKISHEFLFHKLRSKFKCDHCNEIFTKEYLRHVHLLNKHKESVEVVSCEVCGKSFTWRPSFEKHLKKHKTLKLLECDLCDMKCFSKVELRDHLLKHSGEKRFNCNICGHNYITANSLKRHIRRGHKVDPTKL